MKVITNDMETANSVVIVPNDEMAVEVMPVIVTTSHSFIFV